MQIGRLALGVLGACILFVNQPARAHDFLSASSGASQRTIDLLAAINLEPADSASQKRLYSYVATKQIWRPAGAQIRVCFWDVADTALLEKISRIADELTVKLPVSFSWKTDGVFNNCNTATSTYSARVSLVADRRRLAPTDDPSSFFAVIGQDGEFDTRQATVNLPFGAQRDEAFIRTRVLHEFCHVLGCLHEHQRGLCDKDYDEEAIRADRGLTPAQFREQYLLLNTSKLGAQAYGPFDDQSIMLYRTKAWMFHGKPPKSRCYREVEATKLSDLDELGLAAAYSASNQAIASLSLDELIARGAALQAEAVQLRTNAALVRNQIKPGFEGYSLPGVMKETSDQFNLMRATMLDLRADRTEEEASSYVFKPDTIARLREMLPRPR